MKWKTVFWAVVMTAVVFGIGGWSFDQAQAAQDTQSGTRMRCMDRFAAMDTDKSGTVTKEEFMAYRHRRANAEEKFNMRDTNRDSTLSAEEFCKRMGRRGKGGGMNQ